MKCGSDHNGIPLNAKIFTSELGRQYYVSGISMDGICKIKFMDGEKEFKDVPYNKVFS